MDMATVEKFGNWLIWRNGNEIKIENVKTDVTVVIKKDSNGWVETENEHYSTTMFYGHIFVMDKKTEKTAVIEFDKILGGDNDERVKQST